MAIPAITLLPTAPTTADPTTFRARGDAFLTALNTFDDEMNSTIGGVNAILPALDASSAAVNFQGTWSSATAYIVGQSVVYLGITYVAILAGTNQNPTTATTYWLPTGISSIVHGSTSKVTPVDADEIPLIDSVATFGLKKLTWANLKATLFGSPTLTGTPTAPTATAGTNTTQVATTAFATSQDIGVGQTWQNVTGSRLSGTTYANSTGKPIIVAVEDASASNASTFTIHGVASVRYILGGSYVIPNGYTYSSVPSLGLAKWMELR